MYADTSSEIVLLTIDCALHGEVILPSFVARDLALPAARPPVTDGEEFGSVDELLIRGIIGGRSIEALAEELSYSDRTVRRFVQNLMIRCGCTSRAELIVFGVRQGYDS